MRPGQAEALPGGACSQPASVGEGPLWSSVHSGAGITLEIDSVVREAPGER